MSWPPWAWNHRSPSASGSASSRTGTPYKRTRTHPSDTASPGPPYRGKLSPALPDNRYSSPAVGANNILHSPPGRGTSVHPHNLWYGAWRSPMWASAALSSQRAWSRRRGRPWPWTHRASNVHPAHRGWSHIAHIWSWTSQTQPSLRSGRSLHRSRSGGSLSHTPCHHPSGPRMHPVAFRYALWWCHIGSTHGPGPPTLLRDSPLGSWHHRCTPWSGTPHRTCGPWKTAPGAAPHRGYPLLYRTVWTAPHPSRNTG